MDSSGIQSKKESEESQQIVSNNVENNKNEKSQDVDTTLKPKEITNPKIFNNPGHQYKKSVQLRECVTSERMRDSTYKPCYPERNPKEFTDNSENRDNRDPLYDNYGGNGVTHIDTHKNCKSGININIVSQQPCENIKLEKPLYTVSFKKCYDKLVSALFLLHTNNISEQNLGRIGRKILRRISWVYLIFIPFFLERNLAITNKEKYNESMANSKIMKIKIYNTRY